jgi:hypothetical protein
MVDRSQGDRGTVSYANAAAGVAYDANVMAVVATNSGARFAYTVPSTAPASVRGLVIVWKVTDNAPDAAGFSIAPSPTAALAMVANGFTPAFGYTVNSGGLDTGTSTLTGLRGYAWGNAAFGTAPKQHLSFVAFDYGVTQDHGVAFYANLDLPLSYQASTPVVRVSGQRALFAYTIPFGTSLGGTNLAWRVSNGVPDTAGFSIASSAREAATMVNVGFSPAYAYNITSGDISVVQRYVLLGHATGGVWFGAAGAYQQMSFQVFDYAWTADQGTVSYRNLSLGVAYRASVHHVRVTPHTAYFDYVIPTGSLKGTIVVWKVVDLGDHTDLVGFSVAPSLDAARTMVNRGFSPTYSYTVTRGNLTVHMP